MLPRNLHTHTWRCKHAVGDIADYCEAAINAGLKVLGVSEHAPHPDRWWEEVHMDPEQLEEYGNAIRMARGSYDAKLKILKAFECEYRKDIHNYFVDELMGKQAADYLIGGAHWYDDPETGEWPCSFYDIQTARDMRLFAAYTITMIESGLFKFIAHPDVFAHCYFTWDADTKACCQDILAAAVDCKVALEINGLGLRRALIDTPQGQRPPYPYIPFWELAAEYDVEIVCNSDAHEPHDVVANMEEALAIANRFNLKESMMFMDGVS